MSVEHTLAMIKPVGMVHVRDMIKVIKKEGFTILGRRNLQLTPEQASDFYQEMYGTSDFPLLVATTSSGPVFVLCLGRAHAVDKLNDLVQHPISIYPISMYLTLSTAAKCGAEESQYSLLNNYHYCRNDSFTLK